MRRNQLSFRLENFAEEGNRKIVGYIDANNMQEVMHEMLLECHKLYYPDMPFDDFCKQVQNYNEQRFGATDVREVK